MSSVKKKKVKFRMVWRSVANINNWGIMLILCMLATVGFAIHGTVTGSADSWFAATGFCLGALVALLGEIFSHSGYWLHSKKR